MPVGWRNAFSVALAAALAIFLGLGGAASAADYPYPLYVSGDSGVHDPVVVPGAGGVPYSSYATGGRVRVLQSNDNVHFSYVGDAFSSTSSWWLSYNPAGELWAPDVSYRNGQYWMYYAVSQFGTNTSAIGLATSPTGAPGSWIDQGVVISSSWFSPYNAIDPQLLVDENGGWWLTFGSFWNGIYITSLNPATGKLANPGMPATRIAARGGIFNNPIEAPFIQQHDGFYYLFVSFDSCCKGLDSTYNIRVGRSASPAGPYVDKSGVPMTSGGGTLLLETHDWVVGPGHSSVAKDAATGQDLLVYHYYDGRQNGVSKLGLNCLEWGADGWPFIM
ncbi:arabinan endo-1,5-alpha-L-arabinosidase [Streptomyces virginiae]|uniref:arabinan endo-1,5-alpha-L-arabinosidase n=1 Tax=Streptomyces virginiae TaxID=1961 RepID=UPI003318566F